MSALNEFANILLESMPYFKWLQRRDDPPAPKFHNFEQQLGWNWEKMLEVYAGALDMHRNEHQESKDSISAACAKLSEFVGGISLTFGHNEPPDLMEDVQHDRPVNVFLEALGHSHDCDAMDIVEMQMEDVEMEDISHDTPPGPPSLPPPAYTATTIGTKSNPGRHQSTVNGTPVAANSPQVAANSPQVAANSPQVAANGPQVAANGPRMPAVPGLRAIWEMKKAEAAAARSTAESQAAAARDASFRQRETLPAVPEEEENDAKSDKDNDDTSDEYVDCKGDQMRTPESLRSLEQLLKEFSKRSFQEHLRYEFTNENIDFEIDELYTAGEKVSKSFVACILLACEYVTSSRRRKIARASQMLQDQLFRDFQVNLRRLRQRLERIEKTPEFGGDDTLVNLLASLRQAGAVLDEDGQVSWTV